MDTAHKPTYKRWLISLIIIVGVVIIISVLNSHQNPIACTIVGGKYEACPTGPCIPSDTVVCISDTTPPCKNNCFIPWLSLPKQIRNF